MNPVFAPLNIVRPFHTAQHAGRSGATGRDRSGTDYLTALVARHPDPAAPVMSSALLRAQLDLLLERRLVADGVAEHNLDLQNPHTPLAAEREAKRSRSRRERSAPQREERSGGDLGLVRDRIACDVVASDERDSRSPPVGRLAGPSELYAGDRAHSA